MNVKIENNELVIRIPLEKPKPSSSGKTLIVASSGSLQGRKELLSRNI